MVGRFSSIQMDGKLSKPQDALLVFEAVSSVVDVKSIEYHSPGTDFRGKVAGSLGGDLPFDHASNPYLHNLIPGETWEKDEYTILMDEGLGLNVSRDKRIISNDLLAFIEKVLHGELKSNLPPSKWVDFFGVSCISAADSVTGLKMRRVFRQRMPQGVLFPVLRGTVRVFLQGSKSSDSFAMMTHSGLWDDGDGDSAPANEMITRNSQEAKAMNQNAVIDLMLGVARELAISSVSFEVDTGQPGSLNLLEQKLRQKLESAGNFLA